LQTSPHPVYGHLIMSSRFQPVFFSFRYWPFPVARRSTRMTL
jgi:hypothetical protein